MDKRLRKYYYAAVLNLFLWGPVLSFLVLPSHPSDPFHHHLALASVGAGMLLAALLQHWTYYDVYHPRTRLTTSATGGEEARSPRR